MATYVNNLRLKEITTGDEDGTWGTSTNTNLELITDGFSYGTKQMSSDANQTFTMPDATADATRGFYLKITSAGSLTGTRVVTLGPNTVSKVWLIENSTTGSQIITIKQGSGGSVNIANGSKVMIITDGAGAGAAVLNANPTEIGGSVTSVQMAGGSTGLTYSGGPITGSGTITTAGTLAVANGGTGATALTANNVVLGNGTSAVQVVAPGTSGNVLKSDGTTWTSGSAAASGVSYVAKTANFTVSNLEGVLANTAGGAFTVTLPASPSVGDQVVIADAGGAFGTNNCIAGRNGSTIEGANADLNLNINGVSVQFVYSGSTWEVYAQVGGNGGDAVTLAGTQTLTNKTINYANNTLTGVVGVTATQTLTNKTINYANNTLTGVVGVTATQTLTNKTLTSPVLGGTTTTASGNIVLSPATQIVEVKGNGSSVEGQIKLNCHANTHGQTVKAQPHSESITNTMLLPKGANSTLVSEIGLATLTGKTIVDTVYALSGTAFLATNGGVQTKTVSANVTFSDSLVSGDAIVLMLESGASYTVTWPTITWVTSAGNVAPTLTAKDTIVLWKVSSVLYGAYTGSYV